MDINNTIPTLPTSNVAASQQLNSPANSSIPSYAGIASTKAVDVDQQSGMRILQNQRLHRPVSPHLGIYKWQVTWILSSLNRITGSVLSGGLYIFGALYCVAPLLGFSITSAGMAAGFAKWPLILKVRWCLLLYTRTRKANRAGFSFLPSSLLPPSSTSTASTACDILSGTWVVKSLTCRSFAPAGSWWA